MATGLPAPARQGNAIGRSMLDLDSPGLGHRITLFLELSSKVSSFDVVLQPT